MGHLDELGAEEKALTKHFFLLELNELNLVHMVFVFFLFIHSKPVFSGYIVVVAVEILWRWRWTRYNLCPISLFPVG